ncbi:DUF4160 domain-containing protein [Dyadobacter chenhuakuii]|uniref:DUF4160 domain-containing protein n=1 Tax=Dyadobacter chenhuakuii TaxID=2909339 RepID=A0A9X1QI05_9BACT|nr:DUF4160 domain-containing protein [Dyadobacter chenhuakuii]MCF2493644.1 DUF4160 domain-containing protein [Dyadobacter chenhuakuii]MCF2500847.1 DUF4160 domain-containing protein [Dyadobacter chenhuakuii]USJ30779.1 DUF4160 domain-containing protein [Dyadobacter chenhuakuii]
MPKILEYFGIVFYFYSNDHLPIHVHVSYNEYETVFEIFFEEGKLKDVRVREVSGIEGLPAVQFKEARKVIEAYAEVIVNRWTDFFVLKKKVSTLRITKKL